LVVVGSIEGSVVGCAGVGVGVTTGVIVVVGEKTSVELSPPRTLLMMELRPRVIPAFDVVVIGSVV
jgi:hypothetical protein